jgi:hypothetical protein
VTREIQGLWVSPCGRHALVAVSGQGGIGKASNALYQVFLGAALNESTRAGISTCTAKPVAGVPDSVSGFVAVRAADAPAPMRRKGIA